MMVLRQFLFPMLLLLAVVVSVTADADTVAPDTNEGCGDWAARGECERNPGYVSARRP